MSSKITDLPAATSFSGSDLLTAVQGVTNVKVTRDLVLQASGGEDVGFSSTGGGSVSLNGVGAVGIAVPAGQGFAISWNLGIVFEVDTAGLIILDAVAGQELSISGNGAAINLSPGGGIAISPAGGRTIDIAFITTSGGVFATADPLYDRDAIMRIAVALALLQGFPIP